MRLWILMGLLAWGTTGCGSRGPAAESEAVDPFSPESIPAALRPGGSGGTPIARGGNLPDDLRNNAGVVLDSDEIVFTDPDAENPEEILPELEELLSAKPTEGPWRRSHTEAFREALRSDKPVLMWFTDSQNSPPCRNLSQELFNQTEFDQWAAETFVRLQLDQRVGGSKLDHDAASKAGYIEDMKKRYKVMGQPTLLVLTPSGEVIGRYRGYQKGQHEFKWGQLRQGAHLAREAHVKWKAGMEKKGYRTWRNPLGRSIFAKLAAYRDGQLILVEPDGTRLQTKERYLSVEGFLPSGE